MKGRYVVDIVRCKSVDIKAGGFHPTSS